MAKQIAATYMKRIKPHLGEVTRADAITTLSNELDVLGVQVQMAVSRTVGPLFDRMARDVSKGNAKGQALMGIKPSETGIPGLLSRARDANIALVEKAHRAYAASVRDIVGDPDNFGLRVEDLTAKLLERGDVSESRAELIARDQTLKLNGEIAATRQQAAGVDRYVWSTSQDDRVREEHAALEGETFEWTSPPEPGHPGEDFQCRCIAIPVGIEELDEAFSDG